MPNIAIHPLRSLPHGSGVEIVERKGIGHPDTICDALAEEFSVGLSRFYLDRFGLILHHNVDKALLCGGAARAAFGGGEVLEPIDIYLSGRATAQFKSVDVPIADLAIESCHTWLRSHFHVLEPEKHVRLHVQTRPGSSDLVELYLRQHETGCWLANDSSCGVGYAPLSRLERAVLEVEQQLNSPAFKAQRPEVGEDVKVMAVRTDGRVELTVACAFIDRFLSNREQYLAAKSALAEHVGAIAEPLLVAPLEVLVNAADNPDTGDVFLTVTGTSAESGDDGEVGRGNRANGLIAPGRPMTMEATAGKNPVTHVGKLYNVAARLIAQALVDQVPEISAAECYLVSAIGSPVNEPRLVEVRLELADSVPIESVQPQVRSITSDLLASVDTLWKQIVDRQVRLF